ncbi:hypothetical protein Q1695_013746 [Nippostrongylus brasiliensis]|nr:hypothetical protein Q1695_013746 [Nippostrongylus brasiliensis]
MTAPYKGNDSADNQSLRSYHKTIPAAGMTDDQTRRKIAQTPRKKSSALIGHLVNWLVVCDLIFAINFNFLDVTTAGENEARDYTPLREGPPSVYGRSAQLQTAHLRNEGAANVEPNPRSTSEEPTAFLGSTDEISVAVFTKPSGVRLLTKGYLQKLVDAALARVPREGLRHVQYYIKALGTLEMKGVEADKAMNFLVDSRLSDRQLPFALDI